MSTGLVPKYNWLILKAHEWTRCIFFILDIIIACHIMTSSIVQSKSWSFMRGKESLSNWRLTLYIDLSGMYDVPLTSALLLHDDKVVSIIGSLYCTIVFNCISIIDIGKICYNCKCSVCHLMRRWQLGRLGSRSMLVGQIGGHQQSVISFLILSPYS